MDEEGVAVEARAAEAPELWERARKQGMRSVWLTLIAIVLLGLALANTEVGASTFAQLASSTAGPGLLLAALLVTGATPIAALRWRALLPEPAHSGSVEYLTRVQCVGVLFNYALPGPVGEVVAAVLVKRRYGVTLAEAMVAGLVTRLLGLCVAAVLAGIAWSLTDLALPPDWQPPVAFAAVAMAVAGLGIGICAVMPDPMQRLAHALLGPFTRLPGILGKIVEKVIGFGDNVFAALSATVSRGFRPLAQATGWTVLGHLLVPLGIWIACQALAQDAPYLGTLFTNTFVTYASLALFLFPGSQLGWDLLFASVLSLATGVDPASAGVIAVVLRLQQTLVVLLGVAALPTLSAASPPEVP